MCKHEAVATKRVYRKRESFHRGLNVTRYTVCIGVFPHFRCRDARENRKGSEGESPRAACMVQERTPHTGPRPAGTATGHSPLRAFTVPQKSKSRTYLLLFPVLPNAGGRYGLAGLLSGTVSINELASGEHNCGSQAIAAEVAKRATLRLVTSRGLNNELNLLCSCAGE